MATNPNQETKAKSEVIDFLTKARYSGKEPPEPPMELIERVGKLEERANDAHDRLVRIEVSLDAFKGESFRAFSTKADVAEAKNSIIMWVVSAILLAQLLPALLKKFGL